MTSISRLMFFRDFRNTPPTRFRTTHPLPITVTACSITSGHRRTSRLPAKTDLVIYEMLFRDFTGTEGQARGNGTVRAAIEKDPLTLKELGINAVELLPITMSSTATTRGVITRTFISHPTRPAHGTPQDYKEFIDLCHKEGIAVILDVVSPTRATGSIPGSGCTRQAPIPSSTPPRLMPTACSTTGTRAIRSWSASGPTCCGSGSRSSVWTVSGSTL